MLSLNYNFVLIIVISQCSDDSSPFGPICLYRKDPSSVIVVQNISGQLWCWRSSREPDRFSGPQHALSVEYSFTLSLRPSFAIFFVRPSSVLPFSLPSFRKLLGILFCDFKLNSALNHFSAIAILSILFLCLF